MARLVPVVGPGPRRLGMTPHTERLVGAQIDRAVERLAARPLAHIVASDLMLFRHGAAHGRKCSTPPTRLRCGRRADGSAPLDVDETNGAVAATRRPRHRRCHHRSQRDGEATRRGHDGHRQRCRRRALPSHDPRLGCGRGHPGSAHRRHRRPAQRNGSTKRSSTPSSTPGIRCCSSAPSRPAAASRSWSAGPTCSSSDGNPSTPCVVPAKRIDVGITPYTDHRLHPGQLPLEDPGVPRRGRPVVSTDLPVRPGTRPRPRVASRRRLESSCTPSRPRSTRLEPRPAVAARQRYAGRPHRGRLAPSRSSVCSACTARAPRVRSPAAR